MTDRQYAGFAGPVKRVFEEWSPIYRPWGDIPTGTRCRKSSTTFDNTGRAIQHSIYAGRCGEDEIREYYSYDREGSRTTRVEQIHGKDSTAPPPIIANPDWEPGTPKDVRKYDAKGRLAEESTIAPSGKIIDRYEFLYDGDDRLIESRGYVPQGRVEVRRVWDYEGNQRGPSTFAYYGRNGKVNERTRYAEYEVNARGDWVSRKEFTEETLNRKTIALVYRKIEYY
jgi:hypothetical protein